MKWNETIEAAIAELSKLPNVGVLCTPELKDNLKATLNNAFQKLELVTRDEFDIQVALLKKTRSKLETLQQQLEQLEKSQRMQE